MARPSTEIIRQVMKELATGGKAAEVKKALYREMAAKGGSTKTPTRAAASRSNGKLGGKPTKERLERAEALLKSFKAATGARRLNLWNEFLAVATRKLARENWTPDLPRPDWL